MHLAPSRLLFVENKLLDLYYAVKNSFIWKRMFQMLSNRNVRSATFDKGEGVSCGSGGPLHGRAVLPDKLSILCVRNDHLWPQLIVPSTVQIPTIFTWKMVENQLS